LRATLVVQISPVNQSHSVDTIIDIFSTLVVIVDHLVVVEGITSEVTEKDEGEEDEESKNQIAYSPASKSDEESESSNNSRGNSQSEQSLDVPGGEDGVDDGVTIISIGMSGKVGENYTRENQTYATNVNEVGNSLVVKLQSGELSVSRPKPEGSIPAHNNNVSNEGDLEEEINIVRGDALAISSGPNIVVRVGGISVSVVSSTLVLVDSVEGQDNSSGTEDDRQDEKNSSVDLIHGRLEEFSLSFKSLVSFSRPEKSDDTANEGSDTIA